MSERRSRPVDRRFGAAAKDAIPESGGTRDKQRRLGDRRESTRVPMTFLVRDLEEGGSYHEREGDLSIGGIYWTGRYPPQGSLVEVRFRLTGVSKEIRAKAEIIRLSERGGGIGFHVRFTEVDLDSELAIARFIDEAAGAQG